MEHTGFQNAPGVTAFAVGMRVHIHGTWQIIRWVDDGGNAHCQLEPNGSQYGWIPHEQLYACTLYRDSVWVDKPYCLQAYPATVAVVLARMGELVTFNRTGRDGGNETLCWPVGQFLNFYRPLPLRTVPDTGTGEWKPEARKTAWWNPIQVGVPSHEVRVICFDAETGLYVCHSKTLGIGGIHPTQLMPVPAPPEPPVKAGEYLSVTRRGTEYVGHARNVDPVSHMFQVGGSSEIFDWDDAGTSIVHLIRRPEDCHD